MSPQVGVPAPDFRLNDQHGQQVALSDFRGDAHVALVFFPFAFSGLCTGELCEIRDNLADFAGAGVQVVGISCDPMYSLRAFADAEGYEFPLLSDFWPHGVGGPLLRRVRRRPRPPRTGQLPDRPGRRTALERRPSLRPAASGGRLP